MSRLVFPGEQFSRLRAELLKSDHETCAILFGRTVVTDGRLARLVVRETLHAPPEAYAFRSLLRAQLAPEFVAAVAQRARRLNESLVFVHTHPFALNAFSKVDDAGERPLAEFLAHRVPDAKHAALLLTPATSIARQLGTNTLLRVVSVGPELVTADDASSNDADDRYDRQVRAFGRAGQERIRRIRVAIVGVGGTGSLVLQMLSHLGVEDIVLIDPDTIETTNLNRVVGAIPSDVGQSKVSVAARWAGRINPGLRIEARQASVLNATVAHSLVDTDFVFSCTDSHGSRAVLNQLAYQYLLPVIDMGVVIAVQNGSVSHIAARTQLLAPGLACQVCGNLLDPEEIRRDLLTDFERQADPYILGAPAAQPAVISLNSTISSLAVTMFLNVVAGVPGSARLLNYNALTGTCRPAVCTPHPTCVVCSFSGSLARGDEWPLPARQD